jgi:hypothetical protein
VTNAEPATRRLTALIAHQHAALSICALEDATGDYAGKYQRKNVASAGGRAATIVKPAD